MQGQTTGVSLRGLPLMTSANFSAFRPSLPCPHFHATSLTELPYFIHFSRTPSPSNADVINGSSLKPEIVVPCAQIDTSSFMVKFPSQSIYLFL